MNCTGKRCIMQYSKVDPATCTAVTYCPQATPPKTNADRIRAMSDEELAKFLCDLTGDCYRCPGDNMCYFNAQSAYNNAYGMSVWLKEEAENE